MFKGRFLIKYSRKSNENKIRTITIKKNLKTIYMLIAICAIIYPHSRQMGFFLPPASQSAYAWCILISYSISSHSSRKQFCFKNAMKSFQTSSSFSTFVYALTPSPLAGTCKITIRLEDVSKT